MSICRLPVELLDLIFNCLNFHELWKASQVCSYWRELAFVILSKSDFIDYCMNTASPEILEWAHSTSPLNADDMEYFDYVPPGFDDYMCSPTILRLLSWLHKNFGLNQFDFIHLPNMNRR